MIARARKPKPADQLVVLDIGNTSVSVGVWQNSEIRVHTWVPSSEPDLLAETITKYWETLGDSKQVAACSVVPDQLEQIRKIVTAQTGEALLVVGESLPPPIAVKISEPDTVGMDRLCCAAAAYAVSGTACAIADAGTAITVDCVDDEGRFIGGAILSGLQLQARALADHTALLPNIRVEKPKGPLGQSTEQAMCSGIFHGSVGAIKGLVDSYATVLGHWPALFLTGHDAALLAQDLEIADRVMPDLCLRGVALAYQQAYVEVDTEL